MYCSNCGSQVDGKFCTNCGFPVSSTQDESTTSPLPDNVEQRENSASGGMGVQSEIVLIKTKMIGRITYKTITTTVALKPDAMDIRTETERIFRRDQTYTKTIRRTDIQNASVRTVMDFWDTLYAIIFAVLGLSVPILFIGAVICLWCGYGKEIEILLSNGEKTRIPTNSGNSANVLVALLNK